MIISTIVSLFAKPLVDSVFKVFNKYQDRKVSEAEMKAQIEKEVIKTLGSIAEQQSKTIIAEVNSDNWLAKSWRPIAGLAMVFIFFFYAVITPVAVAWFGAEPVRVGDILLGWVFDILKIGMSGYVGMELMSQYMLKRK